MSIGGIISAITEKKRKTLAWSQVVKAPQDDSSPLVLDDDVINESGEGRIGVVGRLWERRSLRTAEVLQPFTSVAHQHEAKSS